MGLCQTRISKQRQANGNFEQQDHGPALLHELMSASVC